MTTSFIFPFSGDDVTPTEYSIMQLYFLPFAFSPKFSYGYERLKIIRCFKWSIAWHPTNFPTTATTTTTSILGRYCLSRFHAAVAVANRQFGNVEKMTAYKIYKYCWNKKRESAQPAERFIFSAHNAQLIPIFIRRIFIIHIYFTLYKKKIWFDRIIFYADEDSRSTFCQIRTCVNHGTQFPIAVRSLLANNTIYSAHTHSPSPSRREKIKMENKIKDL